MADRELNIFSNMEITYPQSRHIEFGKLSDIIADYSMNKDRGVRLKKTLRDTIADYVFHFESGKHLFCIHPREQPEFYYDKTVISIPRKLTRMHKLPFPQVIIVTENVEDSQRICRKLLNGGNDFGVLNLDLKLLRNEDRDSQSDRDKVMKIDDLAASVKFIIINNAEKIIQVPHFKNFMGCISDKFELSWTRFIFMYKFVNAPSSLLETVKICREFHKQGMFIEVDKPIVPPLFQRIQFIPIVPPEEIADHLAAMSAQNSEDTFPYEKYEEVKRMATTSSQKLKKCMELIKELRKEREEKNKEKRANRKERILIVTENHATARFVRLMLVPHAGVNNINTIVEYDSIEHVEKRNFEFRHGCLDVLVIDWKSIRSVIRGTVDSVIMYNRPHPNYFQTVMETEMENLFSRNCTPLKLFILLHQTEDLILIPEYLKFVQKYNKTVPQWFLHLYQKFRSRLNALKVERNFCKLILFNSNTRFKKNL
ncbi:unnamed protein product [Caenorhabditis brenneri]